MFALLATLQRVRFPLQWRIGPQTALFLNILLIIHIGEKFVDSDQVILKNLSPEFHIICNANYFLHIFDMQWILFG